MKIEPGSSYTREIDVPAEEVEQVIAKVNEWLADIDDGDLDSVIESIGCSLRRFQKPTAMIGSWLRHAC